MQKTLCFLSAALVLTSAMAQSEQGSLYVKPTLVLDTQLTDIVDTSMIAGHNTIVTLGLGETSRHTYVGIYKHTLDSFKTTVPLNKVHFTSPEIITHFGRPQSEIPLQYGNCALDEMGQKKTLFYLIKTTGRPKMMAVFHFCNNKLESHHIQPIP